MSLQRVTLGALLVVALLAPGMTLAQPAAPQAVPVPQAGAGCMIFVENTGQWPEGARFQVWGGAGIMWLAGDAIWITVVDEAVPSLLPSGDGLPFPLSSERRGKGSGETRAVHGVNLKFSFVGANSHPVLEPFAPLETKVNYLLGYDRSQWHPEVPVWGGARYHEIYPGVDFILGGDPAAMLTWRLEAQPGARARTVHLRVEGAESLTLEGQKLHISTPAGEIALPLPLSNVPLLVDGLVEDGNPIEVDREPAMPHPSSAIPLNDPADLLYGTFLGSNQNTDQAYGGFVDSAGRVYLTGQTWSSGFPTTPGVFDPTFNGGYDAFVVRLNADGRTLSYSTFLGGSGYDQGNAVEVDATDEATVAGETWSSNFPTTPGAYDPTSNGESDGFVVRLSSTGSSLLFGTYLGGSQSDHVWDVSLDPAGRALVAGDTYSSNFPTTAGVFDPTYNGNWDAFVVRLSETGTSLDWSTFLGGNAIDGASSIVVDTIGRPSVTGVTASSDFPTTPGSYDPSYNGYDDSYVVRFDAAGSAVEYATFLGGSQPDYGNAIALAPANRVCITGSTSSFDFPTTPLAFDLTANGDTDAFVACIGTEDSTLELGTYLGGGSYDYGSEIWVDSRGQPYVTGPTSSGSFPITAGTFDTTHNGGGDDAFLVRLSSDGRLMSYGTFLGGSGQDRGIALALDAAQRAYISGYTDSTDFPTTATSFDPSYNGAGDAYAVRLVLGDPADLDGDGRVTALDLVIIANAWGQAGVFDLDGDGLVTIVDIMIVAANWEGGVT